MGAAVAIALVVLAVPAGALAADRQIALPDTNERLTPSPPLPGGFGSGELDLVRVGQTKEAVRVGVDARGRPVAIEVDQRILLTGLGDYAFVVPAPVREVRASPGARVQPGLLEDAIVWQGFSPGKRTLAAVATLDTAIAAASLPLALAVRTLVDGVPLEQGQRRSGRFDLALEIRNRTAVTVDSFGGRGDPAELAFALDDVRRSVATGRTPNVFLVRAAVAPRKVTVDAGFRVRGSVRLPASLANAQVVGGNLRGTTVSFAGVLGAGRAATLRVRVQGRVTDGAPPHVTVGAAPVLDVPGLAPPRGGSWRQALARRLVAADGRALLDTAVTTMLRLARTNQYRTFLASPGPAERTLTTYSWTTAPPPATASATPASGGGNGALRAAAAVVAAVLGLGVALGVWARL